MKKLCCILNGYPYEQNPANLVFVQVLLHAFVDMGVNVNVIIPVSLFSAENKILPHKAIDISPGGNEIAVYYPRFFNALFIFTVIQNFFGFSTYKTKLVFQWRSCKRVIKNNNLEIDAFYSKFLSISGMCACNLGRHFKKPVFIDYGESSDWSIVHYGDKYIKKMLKYCDGIIAVSTENKNLLVDRGLCEDEDVVVCINGINKKVFYPRAKEKARNSFGFDKEIFIVAFAGSFISRKGIMVLNEAVSQLDDVYIAYAGSGELNPEGAHIIYKDIVNPERMPFFLSAADVFALPTINEGCSNAIIEALACGLPVISSDLPFNYDILDDSCSILIDPNSVDDIKKAILKLKYDCNLRNELVQGSIEKANNLTITKRVKDMISFMDTKVSMRN